MSAEIPLTWMGDLEKMTLLSTMLFKLKVNEYKILIPAWSNQYSQPLPVIIAFTNHYTFHKIFFTIPHLK